MADSLGGTPNHNSHSHRQPSNLNANAVLRQRVYRQQPQPDPSKDAGASNGSSFLNNWNNIAGNQFAAQPNQVNHVNSAHLAANVANHAVANQHAAALRRGVQPYVHPRAHAAGVNNNSSSAVRPGNNTIVSMKGVGPCVQQLQKFCNEQRRGHVKNSLEGFWKPFVNTFFTPNATILLDVMTPGGTPVSAGVPNGNVNGNSNSVQNRSIAIPVEAMPRILKSKYDAGVTDEKLLLEMPYEFVLENGLNVVDCPQTTVLTSFPQSKVCTDGHLRVSFTGDKKITKWEFTTRSNEELFTRNVLGRNHIPDPVCTPYGIPFSALMLYAIAESINDMGGAIVRKMATLAAIANNGNGSGNNNNNGSNNNSNINVPDPATITAAAAGTPSQRSKEPPQANKDASNIITQLNETASKMMPEKSQPKGNGTIPVPVSVPSSHLGAGTSAIAPDFGIPMNGRGPSSSANGFDLNTATSTPALEQQASTSNAQLQLVQQMQSRQQQQMVQQMQGMLPTSAAVPTDMISGMHRTSAGMSHGRTNGTNNVNASAAISAEAMLGNNNQWGVSFPNPVAGIFGNGEAVANNDTNGGSTAAPAGLSEFTPGDFGVGGAAGTNNINGDGLNLEGNNAFQLEMYNAMNSTAGTNNNNDNNNNNSGVPASAAQPTGAAPKRTSHSQANTSAAGNKPNKRRRGAQSSAVL